MAQHFKPSLLSVWHTSRCARLLLAAGPLSLAFLLGMAGCAARSPQSPAPVSVGQVPPVGAYDEKNQADLATLSALTPAQRGAYLQQHPDIMHRIYTSHDQGMKVQFAKLMQQR
jgi:hypothetical protein